VVWCWCVSLFRTDSEKLLADFDSKDLSTEEGRGRAVLEMRDKFHRLAERRRHMRHIGGGILLGFGGGRGGSRRYRARLSIMGDQRAPDYVLLVNAGINWWVGRPLQSA